MASQNKKKSIVGLKCRRSEIKKYLKVRFPLYFKISLCILRRAIVIFMQCICSKPALRNKLTINTIVYNRPLLLLSKKIAHSHLTANRMSDFSCYCNLTKSPYISAPYSVQYFLPNIIYHVVYCF